MDACHVVGTVLMYKGRPLVRFLSAVGMCDKSQRSCQCLLSSRDLFHSDDLFILDKQASDLHMLTISVIHYRLVHLGQSTRVVGTLSKVPDKHLPNVPEYECLPNKPVVETLPGIYLGPCTLHSHWHVCHVHQSWKLGC
jgi:hypothetical protein